MSSYWMELNQLLANNDYPPITSDDLPNMDNIYSNIRNNSNCL